MDNTELLQQVNKSITDSIEKSLPEIVETTVSKKIAELESKSAGELEEIKAELKKMNYASKEYQNGGAELAKKSVIVSVFKDVVNQNITTEKGFNEVVSKNVKDFMATDEIGTGAELVFEQFEQDVLRVINEYDIASDVRILPLAKGTKVSLPKATNGITTYFVDEGTSYTGSEAATSFVVIDIAKAATLTDMTEELLDDTMTVPDLYNLIVEFIGESQAEFLETQILTGTGSVKGILLNTNVNVVGLGSGNTADDIDDDAMVAVVTKAARKFKRRRANVKFYLSQYVYGKLKALKTTDGYPLYPELRDANPMLMGYAVVMSDVGFVQDVSEDVDQAPLLLFGDLGYFTMARRKGITIERGYYGDNWKKDIMSVKSNTRYGGTCTFPEALTILINGSAS
jgi:HK97 family phage major capsid protein